MPKLLGIEFAPLNIPMERRLQTLAACYHIIIQMSFFIGFLPLLLLLTWLRWVVILYGLWFYFDFNTPKQGGYNKRIVKWWRTQRIHKYFRDYFPTFLHKTADLPTGTNYLLVCHPHGVYPFGIYTSFASAANGIYEKFPGLNIRVATLPLQFWPFIRREWILSHGAVDCSRESLKYLLDTAKTIDNAVALVVGGAAEALDAHPGKHILTLKNRKGFVRIALETGAQLVPVYSFGENEVYQQVDNPRGSRLRTIQDLLKKHLGFSLPIINGRGIFNYSYGVLPHRRRIDTVVGMPLPVVRNKHPSTEEVDQLHAEYIEALKHLFNENKVKYGIPADEEFVIV